MNKFNIKLVRASIYLSQSKLNIRYKFEKSHIKLNVLNKLFIMNRMSNDKNNVLNIENFHDNIINSKNDVIYVYNQKLITILSKFEKNYKKIIEQIKFELKFLLC